VPPAGEFRPSPTDHVFATIVLSRYNTGQKKPRRANMLEIPLISFVDFVLASGPSRMIKVREVKRLLENGHRQSFDYYKELRDGIVEMHRDGLGFVHLEQIAKQCQPGRSDNYSEVVSGYRSLVKKAGNIRPSNARRTVWGHRDVEIVVNPEIRVEKNGRLYVAKLYFKKPELSRRKIAVALHLMKRSLGDSPRRDVALIDTRRGKLYPHRVGSADLDPLLYSEVLAFRELWRHV